ncbi:D-alanyl-D-alanine carboxypeptidase/D-alanyl-D-alanine endopeptidase [Saccharothrix australiensis]|uniref:D-alanyl-D-alanine carboxypeptidase/D-alanyl-D-alanine endopeptidase n=1 Tax=Saccharothrix australiensis TaxID=2072 RepID=UPI0011C3FC11|nr:D-alanyl-D-alanine carboxypeptidase/D-alanyl-D-alanine-endopeptidase [Saccharothrix australiensis]
MAPSPGQRPEAGGAPANAPEPGRGGPHAGEPGRGGGAEPGRGGPGGVEPGRGGRHAGEPGRGGPQGPEAGRGGPYGSEPARGGAQDPEPGRGGHGGPQGPEAGRGGPHTAGTGHGTPTAGDPGRGGAHGEEPARGPHGGEAGRGAPRGADVGTDVGAGAPGVEAAGGGPATGAHAEEPTVEPTAKPERFRPADEIEERPRKRRRLLLVGVLALVVVLAGGAVVTWQAGWLDTAPVPTTAAPAPPAPVSPALKGVGPDAPAPTAAGIAAALRGPAGNGVLGTLTGVVVDPATGTALWKQGETTPLTPASTIKNLVAAAALLSLDHTAQLSTKVVQGDQPGTVVLVGGGDPTLSSLPPGRPTVYPGAATLDDLAAQVAARGPVTKVLFDVSRYRGDGLAPGWAPEDVPDGYVSPIEPLMLDGGRQDPTTLDNPRTPTPGATAANALAARLGAASVAAGTAPAGAQVLGEVKSAPVDQLVENMMQISDNVLAETMAREVALAKGMEPTFAGAVQAVRAVLTEHGFDLAGAEVFDASGLSVNDKLPARLLGDILSAAARFDGSDPRTAKLRPLLTALPVAGGSGTLAGRFQGAGAAGKGWVRAKTGTLTGVNSLAGVVVDADGRLLVFAFMSLSTSEATPVRGALDELAVALRGCGCA